MRYLKNPLLIFFLVIVASIESVWILKSNGFYFVDECSHYLYSRFVLQALPITVETWHRPIPQWLFAIPAQFGHTVTMFFACGLFLCLLLITYWIAVLQGIKHAEWVVILVGLQPTLFDISYACMTELPAAFMMALSYFYHLKGKHGWSLLIASLVIMCRSEMYIFAGLMFIVYAYRREWKILPLVLVGPLLWIGSTTIISGNILTFFNEWMRFSRIGKFIPGVPVMHYFANLHTTFGYAQTFLFLAGILVVLRAKKSGEYGIVYWTIGITLTFHTIAAAEIFHWTGSIGEWRYISVAGPFFGIVSAKGVSDLFDKIKSSGVRIACSILVIGVVVFNCTLTTHPRLWANYEQIVLNITRALKAEYPDKTLLSNNCAAAYVMDAAPSGGFHYAPINTKTMGKYSDCLILWDSFSSNSIFFQTELTKEKVLNDTTIRVLERYHYWSAEYLVLYKK